MKFIETRNVAVGVDLGQSRDPTTLAVVEQVRYSVPGDDNYSPPPRGQHIAPDFEIPRAQYNLRLLEQAPLGESYPAQARRIKSILSRETIAKHAPRVLIDYTGVGRAVYDIFKAERVPRLVPVTITFQGDGRNDAGGYSVPKIDLVSKLQALMHTGCLHMPDSLPLAKVFRRELLDFRVSYTAVGNATFGAREGAHDDTILAVALAVWGLDSPRRATVSPLRI